MANSELPTSNTATNMLEEDTQAVVRRNSLDVAAKQLAAESCDDALMAGTMSIADIDSLMGELQTARDFLQSEGERVRHVTANYVHLARTASASVKIIAESLGKWRNGATVHQTHAVVADAPSLSPPDVGESLQESNDQ